MPLLPSRRGLHPGVDEPAQPARLEAAGGQGSASQGPPALPSGHLLQGASRLVPRFGPHLISDRLFS